MTPQAGLLIMNADDWGRDRLTTDPILDCCLLGSVSSVSAMVFMEDSERAAAIAQEKGIETGLHLNFTAPFTGARVPAGLAERQQQIAGHLLRHRLAQIVFHPGLMRSFEYVAASQLDEFRNLYGAAPDRIDGHHHMHLCANVRVQKLLPAGAMVRRSFSFDRGERSPFNHLYRNLVDRGLARRHRLTDYFFSLPPLEPASRLQRMFALARQFSVEVETHPVNPEEHRYLTGGEFFRHMGDLSVARPSVVLSRPAEVDGRRRPVTPMAKSLFAAMALLGSAMLAGEASAAEKYVDNSGSPRCVNSAAAGTQQHPWCTINYAAGNAKPGDIVYVKNGTYREDVYINGRHGGASYITFQSYPGHSPVIRGSSVDSGRNKIIDSSFIKFIGFTITNVQQGLFVETSNNIILQKLEVYDVGQEAVHIKFNSSFVTIEDSIIRDTRRWKYNGEGVYIGTSSSQQPDAPPYDNTHDILVRNNTIYNTHDECIEAKEGTYNVTIDGNTMRECLLDPGITQPTWGAIEVMEHRKYYGSNPNHVIKNNIVHTAKTGIGLHTGATVFNNVIYGQTGGAHGISIDNPDRDNYVRRIYHNTIDLPASRAVVVAAGAPVDIRNNIGPSAKYNIAVQNTFFPGKASGDYHLAPGSAPIDAGANLTEAVAQDIEGGSRSDTSAPDMGAYEFRAGPAGSAPPLPRR